MGKKGDGGPLGLKMKLYGTFTFFLIFRVNVVL